MKDKVTFRRVSSAVSIALLVSLLLEMNRAAGNVGVLDFGEQRTSESRWARIPYRAAEPMKLRRDLPAPLPERLDEEHLERDSCTRQPC